MDSAERCVCVCVCVCVSVKGQKMTVVYAAFSPFFFFFRRCIHATVYVPCNPRRCAVRSERAAGPRQGSPNTHTLVFASLLEVTEYIKLPPHAENVFASAF